MSDIVKREPVEMAGVKKSMSYEGEGVRGREEGRGRCGSHVVERDMRECGLSKILQRGSDFGLSGRENLG